MASEHAPEIAEMANGNMAAEKVLSKFGAPVLPGVLKCLKRHRLNGDMLYYAYAEVSRGEIAQFLADLAVPEYGDKVRAHHAENQ